MKRGLKKAGAATLAFSLLLGSLSGLNLGIGRAHADAPPRFQSLAARENTSAAIDALGNLWVWGANNVGQLGQAPAFPSNPGYGEMSPVLWGGSPFQASKVAVGRSNITAVATDGSVWSAGDNAYGQLGTGAVSSYSSVPVRAIGVDGTGYLSHIQDVASGDAFTFALTDQGEVQGWGNNSYSQIGTGPDNRYAEQILTPAYVMAKNPAWDAREDEDYDDEGEYEDDSEDSNTPSNSVEEYIPLGNVKAISAGEDFGVALKNDGTVWTWGYNRASEERLGYSGGDAWSGTVQTYARQVFYDAEGTTPLIAKSISAGFLHTVVIAQDDSVWTWGYNAYGQLGNGTTTNRALPVRVLDADGATPFKAKQAKAGNSFTVAEALNGSVWAWGSKNFPSSLGDMTTDGSAVPVHVRNNDYSAFALGSGDQLAAGGEYAVALKAGSIVGWGTNYYGGLGDGKDQYHGESVKNYAEDIPGPRRYIVDFNSKGGSPVPVANVEGGQTVAEPAAPTKSGYDFGGWRYLDGDDVEQAWNFDSYAVTTDVTLFAKWTTALPKFTVTFETNGGDAVADLTDVESGTKISEPATAQVGYRFDGWFADGHFGTPWRFDTDTVTSSLTLFAKWTPLPNTVTFATHGGSDIDPLTGVLTGTLISAPTPPKKSGVVFAGWYKDSGYTTKWNFATDTVGSDVTLHARWSVVWLDNGLMKFGNGTDAQSINQAGNLNQPFYNSSQWYKLTYSNFPLQSLIMVGGTGDNEWNSEGSVYYSMATNGTLIPLGDLEVDGSGYDPDSKTGTVMVSGTTRIGTSDVRIQHTYTLLPGKSYLQVKTKITNIGEDAVSNVRFIVGTNDDYIGTSDSPTKTRGNIVDGAFVPIGSATDRAKVLKIVSSETGALLLSTSKTANVIVAGRSLDNLRLKDPITVPIDTGPTDQSYGMYFRFKDLAAGASDSVSWYYAAGALSSLSQVIRDLDDDIVMHTVTFDKNDGTAGAAYATLNVANDERVDAMPETPVRVGYSFQGWYPNANGTGTAFTADTRVVANMTLYAKWTAIAPKYTVMFVESGGSSVADLVDVETGTKIPEPTTTRSGYRFDGWYTDSFFGTKWRFDTDTVTYDLTLYAKWTAVASPSAPSSSTETIYVDVTAGEEGLISKTPIERTTLPDGTAKDDVTLTPDKSKEAAEGLRGKPQRRAKVVIPDPRDKVSELNFRLPISAKDTLTGVRADLEIYTDNVRIIVPSDSLSALNGDLFFRLVPIKKESERKEVEERAKKEEMVREISNDREVKVLGRPMTIETNMQSRPVTLVLPLKDALPTDETAKQRILDNLVVFVEHSDGTKELIRGEIVTYKDGLLGVQFGISKFSTFTMVYMEGWKEYFASLQTTSGLHKPYINGFPDGTFGPEKPVTRAQMAAMLARNSGLSYTGNGVPSYKDDPKKHWAFADIEAVSAAGLMEGYEGGNFKPEQAITRAEMAAIIDRWMTKQAGASSAANGDVAGFADVSAKHWANAYIRNAQTYGFMIGYADGSFMPEQKLSRAEAVKILNRLFERGPLHGVDAASYPDVDTSHWAYAEVEEAGREHRWTKDATNKETLQH